MHFLKRKQRNNFIFIPADFVVKQISDTALMGMVYGFVGFKVTGFNLQTNLFVGITEGHTR